MNIIFMNSRNCEKSDLTKNEEFELPDGSYSVSDIQDHFGYIFKKHDEKTENPSIRI